MKRWPSRSAMLFGMRGQWLVLVSFVMLSALAPLSVQGAVTIRNIPPTPHLAPPGTSLAALADAIKLGVDDKGWQVVSEETGKIEARLKIRTHMALVAIGFDETNYWIDYADSDNLNYNPNNLTPFTSRSKIKGGRRSTIKGPRIHKNYHVWVDSLAKAIEIRAKEPASAIALDGMPVRRSVFLTDELEKLDALRKRDVISDEEFERQKAALPAR